MWNRIHSPHKIYICCAYVVHTCCTYPLCTRRAFPWHVMTAYRTKNLFRVFLRKIVWSIFRLHSANDYMSRYFFITVTPWTPDVIGQMSRCVMTSYCMKKEETLKRPLETSQIEMSASHRRREMIGSFFLGQRFDWTQMTKQWRHIHLHSYLHHPVDRVE